MANPYAAGIQLTANIDKFSASMAIVTSVLGGTLGQVNRIQKGFASWNPAIMAASGAIAGMGLLKAVEGVEKAGEKLIHAKTILSAMVPEYQRLATVQQATDAAWSESDRNRRSVLSDSIKLWKDTFTVTQSQEAASHLLHPVTILKNALDSLKDTIGATFDDTQIISAIRAFDIAGRTTDERIERAVKDYTRTAIGLGSRTDPGKLLTTVTGMGPMAQLLSDKSLTETVPILQALELGSRTPSALYQIYRLWQGGGGALSSRQANEAQIKWGLHKEEDRQERASGHRRISFGKHLSVGAGSDKTFAGFKPGTIFEEELLVGPKQDLAQWGKDVREKLLATRGVDINDTVAVQRVLAEITRANKYQGMGLGAIAGPIGQRQVQREQAQIERIPLDVGDYINAHDPKAIRDAFEDQWKTVNEVIGTQIVPTYMSTILKPLTEIFHSIAVLAKGNPEAVKNWALAISGLGASLIGVGSATLLLRFLPGGSFILALGAIGAALVALNAIDPTLTRHLLHNIGLGIHAFIETLKDDWNFLSSKLGEAKKYPFVQRSLNAWNWLLHGSPHHVQRGLLQSAPGGGEFGPYGALRPIAPSGSSAPGPWHNMSGNFSDIGSSAGKPDAQKFIREQAYANAKAFGDYFGLMPGGGLGGLGGGAGGGGWGGHYSGGSGASRGQRSILHGGIPDIQAVHPHYSGGTGRARGQRSINHGGIPNANVPMLRGTGKNESAEVVNAITEIATNLGIDPRVAIGVARSEGLPGFDPATGHWSSGSNDHGTSWGPFQAHIHSNIPGMRARGQGDVMLEQGLDPRKMENWKKVIEWQLRYAKHHGWREWHGWRGAERAGLDVPHLTDHMTRPEIDAWNAHIPHAAREHTASVFARMRLPHSVRGGGLESGSYGGESYTHAAPGGPQSTTGYGHAPIGAPPRNQHQSQSHVYLDGRVIGEVIEHRITKRHAHTHGPGGHDGRRGLTPVDSWSVA